MNQVVTSVTELNDLPNLIVIYDRTNEPYRKELDGSWTYLPQKTPNVPPGAMLCWGPLTVLGVPAKEVVVRDLADLEAVPVGTVVAGHYLGEKVRTPRGLRWKVAGEKNPWLTEHLAELGDFPMAILRLGS